MSSDNPQQIPIAEPLVEVTRGSLTESRHRGHIVVVEPDGNIVAYLGSPHNVTFLRSSAKPIHTELAASMLQKIGLEPEALKCGIHEPYGIEAAGKLRLIGEAPNVLH